VSVMRWPQQDGAEAASFAGERDQFVPAADTAMEPAEAARQDVTSEEGAQLAFDEGREVLVIGVASRRGGDARAEGLQVLLDDLVERGCLRLAAHPFG